jgi:hypothetical protein
MNVRGALLLIFTMYCLHNGPKISAAHAEPLAKVFACLNATKLLNAPC